MDDMMTILFAAVAGVGDGGGDAPSLATFDRTDAMFDDTSAVFDDTVAN